VGTDIQKDRITVIKNKDDPVLAFYAKTPLLFQLSVEFVGVQQGMERIFFKYSHSFFGFLPYIFRQAPKRPAKLGMIIDIKNYHLLSFETS